jgi:hypothetical protein
MSVVPFAKSVLVAILICASIHAQTPTVVYECSTNYTGKFNQSANEYGDEITLLGNKRVITQIQIEYFAAFVPSGDEVARLRFYENSGPLWMNNKDYKTPLSPPLWETTFPVRTGFNTATISVPNVTVPLRFTWTVQFFGIAMTTTDHAGLLLYGDPTIGSSFNDFWELRATGWSPVRIPGIPKNNFAAKIMAVESAPPPPALSVAVEGNNLRLSWPAGTSGLVLETRASVDSGYWEPVLPFALQVGTVFQTAVPIGPGNRIFRLNSNPQPPLLVTAQAGSVRLRWSAAVGGQTLQASSTLNPIDWTDLPTPSRPIGDYYESSVPTDSPFRFFRLVKKP